jgi:predicted GNAT family acetyltransferase
MTLEIQHDEERRRFYVDLDGKEAYLSYQVVDPKTLDYVSTYVPPDHRRRNLGQQLVLRALDHARDNGLRVVPTCSFVERIVRLHPEYADLTAL